MKIRTYEMKRIFGKEIEINIPTEIEYHFQTGIRRSIKIIPKWTTWNMENSQKPEEVWQLDFVCVYGNFDCKIERTSIQIIHIEDMYNRLDLNEFPLLHFLMIRDESTARSQKQFEDDFKAVLQSLKSNN